MCVFDTLCNKDFFLGGGGGGGVIARNVIKRWRFCPTDMKLKVAQKKLVLPGREYNCPKPFVWLRQDFPESATLSEKEKNPGKTSVGRSSHQRGKCWTATCERLLCITHVKVWKIVSNVISFTLRSQVLLKFWKNSKIAAGFHSSWDPVCNPQKRCLKSEWIFENFMKFEFNRKEVSILSSSSEGTFDLKMHKKFC